VDRTDFLVFEQSPFNAGWWSLKNAAAIQYEVVINIQNG